MKRRRIIALILAITFITIGFIMGYQVFRHFQESITSQHGEKLTDIAASVDRSAAGYFTIYHDSLEYVTGRRGFVEAEAIWADTGNTEELLFRMEENILNQDLQIKTLLAVDSGKILLSTDGNTGYTLPQQMGAQFLCRDDAGEYYLAIIHKRQALTYVAVIDLDALCDYLADSSAVNEEDRLLLVDQAGQLLICHHQGDTNPQPTTQEELAKSPARQIAWQAVGTDIKEVSTFEISEGNDTSTTGYALIGDAGSVNGFFTICVMDSYDEYLAHLNQDTAWFVFSCCVILLGILLLVFYVTTLSRENEKAAKELEQMRQRQITLEKINEQTRQLAHHQRLETIGTLTSSISHEFNNLLTPIMSYSLLTLEKLPPEEEELYDDVLEIYNASQKAKVIISRLSDLSRKSTPKNFRVVSIDELTQKALDIAMPAKPEHVDVKLNLNCLDIPIRANEIQMCQMLLNLILNAFQAMPDASTLQIDTTFDDDRIHLYLTDTGCGIPQDVLGKVFDPFFTTKESGKGTGLGLAIVAQVVEDHMGSIAVTSTVGEGTQFTVSIPRYTETV